MSFKKKTPQIVAGLFPHSVSLEDLDSCSVIKYLLILKVTIAMKRTLLPFKLVLENLFFEGRQSSTLM